MNYVGGDDDSPETIASSPPVENEFPDSLPAQKHSLLVGASGYKYKKPQPMF